jgi:hypothetical protein
MGKPSIKSRKTSQMRKKNRKTRMIKQIKNKEEEISDLQIQMGDFKKQVQNTGEKVINEINRCSRENYNLVEWLKLYDEQLNNYQKEIYDLNIKLYFSSQQSLQQQSPSLQPPPEPQSQSRQSQPQSPTYKSLADYFSSQSQE